MGSYNVIIALSVARDMPKERLTALTLQHHVCEIFKGKAKKRSCYLYLVKIITKCYILKWPDFRS